MRSRSNLSAAGQRAASEISSAIVAVRSASERGRAESIRDVVDAYLVTQFGKAFTAKGFGNKVREWCDQAGLPECTSHGLRKLCLTRLARRAEEQQRAILLKTMYQHHIAAIQCIARAAPFQFFG